MEYREPKVLLLDTENSPLITANWGLYNQDAVWMVEDWKLLSFSYKWLGDKKVTGLSLLDFKDHKKLDDKALTKAAWDLVNEADVILAHNADRFDIRKLNAKFLEHKLPVPASYKTIDTLKIAKKYFYLTSNKLDYIAELLGLQRKMSTGGKELWRLCQLGDETAYKKMVKYCNQDIRVLEDVYLELRKWHTSHPDLTLYTGERGKCKHCQSKRLQKRGFEYLKVKVYQRLFCLTCGAWQRGEEVNHKR